MFKVGDFVRWNDKELGRDDVWPCQLSPTSPGPFQVVAVKEEVAYRARGGKGEEVAVPFLQIFDIERRFRHTAWYNQNLFVKAAVKKE